MRKIAICLILCCCLLFTACDAALLGDALDAVQNPNQEKSFTNAGATLKLTTSFLDFTNTSQNSEYNFMYASDTIGILGIQENKEELFDAFGTMDLEGYANLIAELYEIDATAENKNGFWTFSYTTPADGVEQTFVCVFYETETDFWNVQGYCESSLYAENKDALWQYLTSVTFAE